MHFMTTSFKTGDITYKMELFFVEFAAGKYVTMQTCAPHEKTFSILRKKFRILHKFSVLVFFLVAPSTAESVIKKKKKKKWRRLQITQITGHYKVLKLII